MNNTATLQLEDWSTPSKSGAYAITIRPELKDVTAKNYTFPKDAGFPTTGFIGAAFTLNLTAGSATDYKWTTDAKWVSVTDGVVTIISEGSGDKVTITGTAKNGDSTKVAYSFTLSGWYFSSAYQENYGGWEEHKAYCESNPGYHLPTLSQSGFAQSNATRRVGTLKGEWNTTTTDDYPQEGDDSGARFVEDAPNILYQVDGTPVENVTSLGDTCVRAF